jgi:hypothetical protein
MTQKGDYTNTIETFWSKVNKDTGINGCWLWTGNTNNYGYGTFFYRGEKVLAHRFAYELKVGEIPSGKVIDHLCRNRKCVNPAHMETVSNVVNVLRGIGLFANKKRQTYCIHGHLLAGKNLRIRSDGHRSCKECERLNSNRHYYQRKEKIS